MRINFGQDFYLQQITCPVLSAMVSEGDLVPDEFGYVSRQQVFNAFRRIGISLETATDTTMGNFGHLPHPQRINIFDMNLPVPVRPQRTRNVEHDLSTGIRDGPVPDLVIYRAFEQFIGEDGFWRLENIEAAIEFFQSNPNDIGSGPGGLEAIEVMFDEFALGKENNLTGEEMKALFLDHTYPPAFRSRRDQLLAQVDDSDNGAIQFIEAVQQPWTFLGCFQDEPLTAAVQVPGPDQVNNCAKLCRRIGSTFFSLRGADACYCDGVDLKSPVSNDQCNRECIVVNGCGAASRTSTYRRGSRESEGPAPQFPNAPTTPVARGSSQSLAQGLPSDDNQLLLSGAPGGRGLFSVLAAMAGASTALFLVPL